MTARILVVPSDWKVSAICRVLRRFWSSSSVGIDTGESPNLANTRWPSSEKT